MIELREISRRDELETLRPEWTALWDLCPQATPFQSPEWLLPWWDTFHPGTLLVVSARDGERLSGLAAFYLAPDRILRFLGTGNSDHLDLLCPPTLASAFAAAVLDHLAVRSSTWERCDLLELSQDSALLTAPVPAAIRSSVSECSVYPVATLPASPGRELRRNLRRYGRRLAQNGPPSYQVECGAEHAETMEALFRLHAARWYERHESGVLAGREMRDFHHRVAAGFSERGWLRLFSLRDCAGTYAAVIYAFAANGRLSLYLTGFDPAFESVSPGALLLGFALEESTRAGLREADFLRGRESYKYLWGACDRTSFQLTLTK